VAAKGRCGFSMHMGHRNVLGPRPRGALPCSRAATGFCAHVVVHPSDQEHTRSPCNARSSVFIRMKLRIGWRTWHVGTSSMFATLLPGSIDPGLFHLRDATAVSGIPWIVRTVIKGHTRALYPGNTLFSRRRAKDILMNCKPPHENTYSHLQRIDTFCSNPTGTSGGVEVEGGRIPTADWMLNLQILTTGGFR
jgi:hypothetical protein